MSNLRVNMFASFNQSLSLRNKIKVDYTQLLIRLQSMNSSTVPPPPPPPNVDYLSFSVPIICVSIVLVVVLMMVDCVSSPPRSRQHSAHPARSRSRRRRRILSSNKNGPDICVIEATSVSLQHTVSQAQSDEHLVDRLVP